MSRRAGSNHQEHYMRGKLYGRHPLTIGALILLGLSAYELWIRIEDFLAWTQGVRHLSEVRGTSFLEDMKIIFEAPAMQALGFKMLYLIGVIIFAIICLICRNKRRGIWMILLLAIAAGAVGVFLEIYALSGWVQLAKLVPLALIVIGSISNMVPLKTERRRALEERNTMDPRQIPGGRQPQITGHAPSAHGSHSELRSPSPRHPQR